MPTRQQARETAPLFGMRLINAGFVIITRMASFIWQCLRTLKVHVAHGLSTTMGLFHNLDFEACRLPFKDTVILLFISTRILGCGSWYIIPTRVLDFASTCPLVLMPMSGQHHRRHVAVHGWVETPGIRTSLENPMCLG
jgi:hypothetical protein